MCGRYGTQKQDGPAVAPAHLWVAAVWILATGWAAGAAGPAEQALVRYARGGPDMVTRIEETNRQIAALKARCEAQGDTLEYKRDRAVADFIQTRVPAAYVVALELRTKPRGVYLEALLYSSAMIGWRDAAEYVVPLLAEKRPPRERFFICWALGILGGRTGRSALVKVLESPATENENTLAICCKGLSRSKDKSYLPLIRRTLDRVTSRDARIRVAIAMRRLGDASREDLLIDALDDQTLSDAVRDTVMMYFADAPDARIIMPLARAASRDRGPVGDLALNVLIDVTHFGDASVSGKPELAGPPGAAAAQPDRKGDKRQQAEARFRAREKTAYEVIRWWKTYRGKIEARWRAPRPVSEERRH